VEYVPLLFYRSAKLRQSGRAQLTASPGTTIAMLAIHELANRNPTMLLKLWFCGPKRAAESGSPDPVSRVRTGL
jgi:hypothetical protein